MKNLGKILILFTLISTPLMGKSFGPYKVDKVQGRYVYFSGPDVVFLSAGRKYKIMKLREGTAPHGINDLLPAGICVVYSLSKNGGILSFSHPVTGEFKRGEYFLLVRGRRVDLNIVKGTEEKPVVETLFNLRGTLMWFSPRINYSGMSGYLEVMNLLSMFGLEMETGYYYLQFRSSYPEDVAACIGSYCHYATWYLSILVGFDKEDFALIVGPIIGVVNNNNAFGFNSVLRYGSPFKTYFKGVFRVLNGADLTELEVDGRVALGGGYGSGVAIQYRLSSYPDIEDVNNFLAAGFSYTKRNLIFNFLIGLGMAEEYERGLVTILEFSHLF